MSIIQLEKTILVLWKIFTLFVNTLTADDKYSFLNRDNLMQPIEILLPQYQKTFSQFMSSFPKSILNFEHFQKQMSLIVDVFPKLRTPKKVVK